MSKKKYKNIEFYPAPKDTIKIGIDVDGVLDLYKAYEWVEDLLPEDINQNDFYKDIKKYEDFETTFKKFNINNALDWWKRDDLYDDSNELAYPTIVLIDMLIRRYSPFCDIEWNIISDCFKEHERSKLKFLQRVFPFSFKFYNKKVKSDVPCDVYIDDKISNLRDCYERHGSYTILVQHFYNRVIHSGDFYCPDELFDITEHELILNGFENEVKNLKGSEGV